MEYYGLIIIYDLCQKFTVQRKIIKVRHILSFRLYYLPFTLKITPFYLYIQSKLN